MTMKTIYELDKECIATGASKMIGEKDGRPPNWVETDEPLPIGVAQWDGSKWIELDEYPVDLIALERAARQKRDSLIAETDWLVVKSMELNQNIPAAWELYRQALRDVPQQETFPAQIVWPERPAE